MLACLPRGSTNTNASAFILLYSTFPLSSITLTVHWLHVGAAKGMSIFITKQSSKSMLIYIVGLHTAFAVRAYVYPLVNNQNYKNLTDGNLLTTNDKSIITVSPLTAHTMY